MVAIVTMYFEHNPSTTEAASMTIDLPRRSSLCAVGFLIAMGWASAAHGQSILQDNAEDQSLRAWALRPISAIRLERSLVQTDEQAIPQPRTLPPTTTSRARPTEKSVRWANANLVYNRPYFEEYCLERYGCSHEPLKQPLISSARFFTTATLFPVLPFYFPPRDLLSHRHW
jgi:hypothetical protein